MLRLRGGAEAKWAFEGLWQKPIGLTLTEPVHATSVKPSLSHGFLMDLALGLSTDAPYDHVDRQAIVASEGGMEPKSALKGLWQKPIGLTLREPVNATLGRPGLFRGFLIVSREWCINAPWPISARR